MIAQRADPRAVPLPVTGLQSQLCQHEGMANMSCDQGVVVTATSFSSCPASQIGAATSTLFWTISRIKELKRGGFSSFRVCTGYFKRESPAGGTACRAGLPTYADLCRPMPTYADLCRCAGSLSRGVPGGAAYAIPQVYPGGGFLRFLYFCFVFVCTSANQPWVPGPT